MHACRSTLEDPTLDRLWKKKEPPVSPEAQRLFDGVMAAARATPRQKSGWDAELAAVGEADGTVRVEVVRLALPAYAKLEEKRQTALRDHQSYSSEMPWYSPHMATKDLIDAALGKDLPFERGDLEALIAWERAQASAWTNLDKARKLLRTFQHRDLLGEEYVRAWLRGVLELEEKKDRPDRKWARTARELLGEAPRLVLAPGEVWSDTLSADLGTMEAGERDAWRALLIHCASTNASAPTKQWTAEALRLVEDVGRETFVRRVPGWLAHVEEPRRTMSDHGPYERFPAGSLGLTDAGQEILKGLCFVAGALDEPRLARALGRLALTSFRKIPGVGPRAVKVGNAAIGALGSTSGSDALGQLAMLRVKVKSRGADKPLEKALNAAAGRSGIPREDLEELGVPVYGFTHVGGRSETIGDVQVELALDISGRTTLQFVKPDGKRTKTVPAKLKAEHGAELADIKTAAKDAAAMLSAQRDRIDALFLEEKSWPVDAWRERYLDHPLVGVIARSLVWRVRGPDGQSQVGLFDGTSWLVDAQGRALAQPGPGSSVSLWHPLESSVDDVLAWRRFVEERGIRQPFKQAHREVYLLTDAERRTATYSNRFAAHVVRQHQFHALCAARGWRNKLRLLVDDEYPPATRSLPRHGLRAEYWIEGAGTEYGRDTNEAGAFLFLATDQVRFYRMDAAENRAHAGGGGYHLGGGDAAMNAPLALEGVPALVLSEILRDVDLFVGVASVGSNPEWADGGPENRYQAYWWNFGFGELAESGAGRKDLLGRLLPKLAIAPACELRDRFLVVKGKLRTYKIHLGSGNILMEPNDQYLCIVPDAGAMSRSEGKVQLPFEGDRTLSIILSKAFLLAADDQIADATITRQIRG